MISGITNEVYVACVITFQTAMTDSLQTPCSSDSYYWSSPNRWNEVSDSIWYSWLAFVQRPKPAYIAALTAMNSYENRTKLTAV